TVSCAANAATPLRQTTTFVAYFETLGDGNPPEQPRGARTLTSPLFSRLRSSVATTQESPRWRATMSRRRALGCGRSCQPSRRRSGTAVGVGPYGSREE